MSLSGDLLECSLSQPGKRKASFRRSRLSSRSEPHSFLTGHAFLLQVGVPELVLIDDFDVMFAKHRSRIVPRFTPKEGQPH